MLHGSTEMLLGQGHRSAIQVVSMAYLKHPYFRRFDTGYAMKKAAREFTLVAILACSTFACDSDTPVATTDNPAEDSALALSVMSARGDTLTAAVENVIVNEPLPERLDINPPAAPQAAPPPAVRATLPTLAPTRVVARAETRKPPPTPVPAPAATRVEVASSVVPERRITDQPSPAPVRERAEPAARSGAIKSGSQLALTTVASVCNAMQVGRTFRTQIVQSIRDSNDLVIPAGSPATAEVTSVSKWGAGVGVQVTSVRFRGTNYPVATRVAYVLPEGEGACIPPGTSFDLKTR